MAKSLVINGADFSSSKLTKTELYKKGKPKWDWRMFSHAAGKTFYTYGGHIYSRIGVFGVGDMATTHKIPTAYTDLTTTPYAIKIPVGTASVKISRASDKGSEFVSGQQGYIFFAEDVACEDASYPNAIKYISEATFDLASNESVTLTVPSGANAFSCFTRVSGSYDNTDNPNDVADALGLKIKFV